MAAALYQQTISQMLDDHPDIFGRFRRIHELYRQDHNKWKTEFDKTGRSVLKIIEETERRLCSKIENSNRGKFSGSLSDKFHTEIRHIFPLIDLVGVTIS